MKRGPGTARRCVARAAVVVLAVAPLAGCDVDLERMLDQARYDPYEASEYFADGRSMRRPPEGTVPRHRIVDAPRLVDGVEGGALAATIPLPLSRALLARGRDRYDIYCAACHGVRGDGRTQVAENMELRRPPSLHEPEIVAAPPGRIYRAVALGYGLMPSYAQELGVEDRWAVTAYVRALQLSQAVPLDALPPALRAEARRELGP